jgi:spore germination protein KC
VLHKRLLHFVKVLSILAIIVPCMTGCWDRMEIEERAVILGIAVDLADKSDSENETSEVTHLEKNFPKPLKNLVKVTVQIAVPGRIPLGTSEGGGTSSGKGSPIWVLSAEGYTLDDALMVLQQQLADRMFFGHLRIIVISEQIARNSVHNLNDYFRRSPEVRRSAWMIVSKGSAADLMRAAPQLQRVPTLYLLAMMDNAVRMGKLPNIFLGIFWTADSSLGKEPYLPYVELKKKENMEISGLAYFRNDRMLGVTKPLEIGVFMAINGVKAGGYNFFQKLPHTEEMTMIKTTGRKTIRKITMEKGKPVIHLDIFLEANIEEKSSEGVELNRNKIIAQIQNDIDQAGGKNAEDFIKKMQKEGTDIFGFGEYIRAKEPKYWNREIKTKPKWQEMFKELKVEVNMHTKLRRVGMKAS